MKFAIKKRAQLLMYLLKRTKEVKKVTFINKPYGYADWKASYTTCCWNSDGVLVKSINRWEKLFYCKHSLKKQTICHWYRLFFKLKRAY